VAREISHGSLHIYRPLIRSRTNNSSHGLVRRRSRSSTRPSANPARLSPRPALPYRPTLCLAPAAGIARCDRVGQRPVIGGGQVLWRKSRSSTCISIRREVSDYLPQRRGYKVQPAAGAHLRQPRSGRGNEAANAWSSTCQHIRLAWVGLFLTGAKTHPPRPGPLAEGTCRLGAHDDDAYDSGRLGDWERCSNWPRGQHEVLTSITQAPVAVTVLPRMVRTTGQLATGLGGWVS
jgi:hypothetical protein